MKRTSETGPFLRAPTVSGSILSANPLLHSNTTECSLVSSFSRGMFPPTSVYASSTLERRSTAFLTLSGIMPCSGPILMTSCVVPRMTSSRGLKSSSITHFPGVSVRHFTHPLHLRILMSARHTSPGIPSASVRMKRSRPMSCATADRHLYPITRSRRRSS